MQDMLVTFWVLKLLRSRAVSLEQPLNMEDMSVTDWVLKLLRSRSVREEQLLNMQDMFVTFWVLKLLRARSVREEQFWNMKYMLVTDWVLKLSPNLIEVRALQLENMEDMRVTLAVLKLLRSRSVSLEQLLNMQDRLLPAVDPSSKETVVIEVLLEYHGQEELALPGISMPVPPMDNSPVLVSSDQCQVPSSPFTVSPRTSA